MNLHLESGRLPDSQTRQRVSYRVSLGILWARNCLAVKCEYNAITHPSAKEPRPHPRRLLGQDKKGPFFFFIGALNTIHIPPAWRMRHRATQVDGHGVQDYGPTTIADSVLPRVTAFDSAEVHSRHKIDFGILCWCFHKYFSLQLILYSKLSLISH